jgi:microcystin-dependent protein
MVNTREIINENKGVFAIAIFTAVLISVISANPVPAYASEPFLGEIMFTGFNFAPRGWAFCDGQLLPINQNQALYSLLGTTYGGDGRTDFALPDMRGRSPMHEGTGPGLSTHPLGMKGGTQSEILLTGQMPSHSHNLDNLLETRLNATNSATTETSATGNSLGISISRIYSSSVPNVPLHPDSLSVGFTGGTIDNAGSNAPHDNMAPYLALSCNIALQGVFPSRN